MEIRQEAQVMALVSIIWIPLVQKNMLLYLLMDRATLHIIPMNSGTIFGILAMTVQVVG
ncbi:hypothetical protein D3C75_1237080 [compost metagenome]